MKFLWILTTYFITCNCLFEFLQKNTKALKVLQFDRSLPNPLEYDISNLKSALLTTEFNASKISTFYIHGYKENRSSPTVKSVIEAYLINNDYNLFVIDWSEFVKGSYLESLIAIKKTGEQIADNLVHFDPKKLHLVGHSLGAQLSGVIGREISNKKSGNKIARITGLDPALPGFSFSSGLVQRLSKNDADFVDIIHTDGGLYGVLTPIGTADFYPNGGITLQPGCPTRTFVPLSQRDLCSHQLSVYFWSSSVKLKDREQFIASQPCPTGKFDKTCSMKIGYMGLFANTSPPPSGCYYLITSNKYPYGLGKDGIKFTNEN